MDPTEPTSKNAMEEAEDDRTIAADLKVKATPDDKTINANFSQHQAATAQPLRQHNNSADGILTKNPDNKYMLRHEIARGGMGVIMEAQHINLDRGVAMKVMLDPQDASRQRILHFIKEAQITSQLQHPGIVPIHELGIDKTGKLFYTMKNVTGKTLKEILKELKEGKPETTAEYPLNRLLNILQHVCDAVAYAHSKGIIHRDLKPENIMIGNYGEVLILDWGLAKVLKEKESGARRQNSESDLQKSSVGIQHSASAKDGIDSIWSDSDSRLMKTLDGKALGTPGYMSPEQAQGQVEKVDEKTDIYSLGAILYHMLKLEPTVKGDKTTSLQDVLEKIKTGKIEPLQKTGRASKSLIAITMKALSLRPEDRYQTVKAFQADLEAYLGGFATSAEEFSALTLVKLLILRHKVISVFSIALLGLLITALSVNYRERLRAQKAEKTAVNAEKVAVTQGVRAEKALANLKATAPALISLTDYYIQRQKMDKALEIADQASALVPQSAACHVKRGNLLQVLNRLDDAAAAYETALKLEPANKLASCNLALCRQLLESNNVQKLSSALWEQERFDEARYVILSTLKKQKPDMVILLLKRLLNGANIKYNDIRLDDLNRCSLDLSNSNITDLSPLKAMPLTRLNLAHCTGVHDLFPLKDMPLKELRLDGCHRITSLEPLRGMPLAGLSISGCMNITDLQSLKNMPLMELDLTGCTKITDLLFLKKVPLKHLKLAGCTGITELSPLNGMRLSCLDITGCAGITDLSPLKGIKLIDFEYSGCTGITDYSIIQKMPVIRFIGGGNKPENVTSPVSGRMANTPIQ